MVHVKIDWSHGIGCWRSSGWRSYACRLPSQSDIHWVPTPPMLPSLCTAAQTQHDMGSISISPMHCQIMGAVVHTVLQEACVRVFYAHVGGDIT